MPLQYEFLRHLELVQAVPEERRKKEDRLFSLIPTKQGFTCGHLKICTNGLHGLLKRSGVEGVPAAGHPFREVSNELWRRFFRIDKLETVNRKFAGEIVTDGKSVSVVMRRPTRGEKEADEDQFEVVRTGSRLWGLDPGRREVFVASNEDGDIRRWSTRRFYEEAGYKHATKKIAAWQQGDTDVKRVMANVPTKKSATLAVLERHVRYVVPELDAMLAFSMEKAFRDLKFRSYVLRRRALQRMCDDIVWDDGAAVA